jgi:hypothetical protein
MPSDGTNDACAGMWGRRGVRRKMFPAADADNLG